MKIIIPDIPDEGLEIDSDESIETECVVSPVRAHLKIEKAESEIIVRGNVMADIKLQCGRCMEDFSAQRNIPVEVVYHSIDEIRKDETHEVRNEELDTGFYEGEELDINELMKEQILLNIPMKPLCSDECLGICIHCGTNLNKKKCDCVTDDSDPRFSSLKELLKKKTQER
jgi:uncharacterized protein